MAFKFALTLFLAIAVVEVLGMTSYRVARSPELFIKKANSENDPCEFDSPCGWAVYVRLTKLVDYYVYNCKCKSDELCTKYEDDMSSRAFVYKCRPDDTLFNSTSTTPSPTSTITPAL